MDLSVFTKPPNAFRSVPFWALNDRLDPLEIRRQMLAFKEGGFGGAYLHSRTGLLTEYLGSDWWNAIDAGVEAAKAYDLEAWFYDEDKWPSGYAGGKVPMQNEAYHASCLLRLSKDVPVPPTAELLREDTAWKYVCYRAPMGNAWFNGTCWVDLFNPEMVKAFIDCSYTPYANRYSRQAGGVVKGIFTDEPQVSPSFAAVVKHAGAVSYSPVLRNWFKRENGYDILDNLLSLFEDTGDYCRIRWDYYRAVARCLEDAFSRQIGQFCANSNLVWTGHYNGENGFVGVASNVGDMMIHYRHMKRPGIDWLGLSIAHGLFPAKSLSSVANQYGLERRLSEMFGCSGQNMNFEDRKWIADWHAVLGINHVCPHLSLYSMKGCRKRDYPPTLSPQQPWWPYNKHIEDHMARMSYATTVGNFAADILVLHPMESAWLNAPLDCPANHDLDSIFSGLLNLLMGEHRDFDLGDEQILAEIGKVRPGFLDVGRMSYPIVVLPHMQTIRSSTVRLLVELRKSGGIIFSVNGLPVLVDAKKDADSMLELDKVVEHVSTDTLCQRLTETSPFAFQLSGEDHAKIFSQRRVLGSGQLIILTNTSRLKTLRINVRLGLVEKPVLWNPSTGRIFSLALDSSGCVAIDFAPAASWLISSGDASKDATPEEAYACLGKIISVTPIIGEWESKRLDPNAITLDFCRYSLDNGLTFSKAEPVIGIHSRLSSQGFKGPLLLAYDVTVSVAPESCSLVLEQPGMFNDIKINNHPYELTDNGFYRDHAFRVSHFPEGTLRRGINTITLGLDYVPPKPDSLDAAERYGTEIESIYLIGDFGIVPSLSKEAPAPTQRNQRGEFPWHPIHRFSSFSIAGESYFSNGNLTIESYPFYAGRVNLTKNFNVSGVDENCRYFIRFPSVEAQTISLELNGVKIGVLLWSPLEADITGILRTGENILILTLINSLRNLLGPHHHRDGELVMVGPQSFTGESSWTGGGPGELNWYDLRAKMESKIWRDDYHCIPFGLLEPPQLVCVEK